VLFNITGGTSLGLYEVDEAAQIIKETADPEANIIFGTVIDERMGDDLQITVIATGFDSKRRDAQRHGQQPAEVSVRSAGGRDFLRELESQKAANTGAPPAAQQPAGAAPQAPGPEGNGQPRPYPEQGAAGAPPQAQPGQPAPGQAPGAPSSTNVRAPELEDLDIPAFLRRSK
jgi:cell division protein FtsZ